MTQVTHVLVNGLSIPPGGMFTVTREILNSLGHQRPNWKVTLLLSAGRSVHLEFESVPFPPNVSIQWATAATSNRGVRIAYENTAVTRWASENHVHAALQVNGMIIPTLKAPTFSLACDPWPYRPDLWRKSLHERALATLKRREHARALREAAFVGWTSGYLRDLVCNHLGFEPSRSEIFYNGLPNVARLRARQALPEWTPRPMEVLTVSNVVPYKRQDLVINAVAQLMKRQPFRSLRYRIIGECAPAYRKQLMEHAASLGIADRVMIEGRVTEGVVEQALATARAFAFMSVCECFGIPPLEAMTFGTPVVAADCCSAREIYGDAVEYCPPDNLEALVESLALVLTDTHRAQELRQKGAQRVQRFSWDHTAARIGIEIESMVKHSR